MHCYWHTSCSTTWTQSFARVHQLRRRLQHWPMTAQQQNISSPAAKSSSLGAARCLARPPQPATQRCVAHQLGLLFGAGYCRQRAVQRDGTGRTSVLLSWAVAWGCAPLWHRCWAHRCGLRSTLRNSGWSEVGWLLPDLQSGCEGCLTCTACSAVCRCWQQMATQTWFAFFAKTQCTTQA